MSKKNYIINNEKIMQEWNWGKNNALNIFPDKLTYGSRKKVWWICSKCGFEWQATIGHRLAKARPTNCPRCAREVAVKNRFSGLKAEKNIKKIYPYLLIEWDFEKNIKKPEEITKGSHEKIWWKCKNGHSWSAPVANRVKGHGCPYCSGRFAIKGENDLVSTNSTLLNEWNFEKNNALNIFPDNVTKGSNKKVWWKCKNGHEWMASIANRSKKRGCPTCSAHRKTSLPEKTIFFYLSKVFEVEGNKKIGSWEFDLFIPEFNLAIEYDGQAWHKNIDRDKRKDEFCLQKGINLIRIRESNLPEYDANAYVISVKPEDELRHMEEVILKIVEYIDKQYDCKTNLKINIKNDYYIILNLIEKHEDEKSLANQFPELLSEWNYEKNAPLTPDKVSVGSSKKVWWKCKNGHEWRTSVANRTNISNRNKCPFCQHKKIIIGVNDLVSLKVDFLKDWNYEKNLIGPENFMKNSGKVVWWKCSKCGFEWQATIDSRSKHGCRYCARKEAWQNRVKKVRNIDTNEIFKSAQEAGSKYNIKPSFITRVCSGKRKTTGGFRWEYVIEE